MADSDDDFSETVQESLPKKSKLSKRKNKDVKKPHTSTQKDVPEPLTARGGRPARKTAEELQFQRELEEALRISSTDVSSSSAEILPVNRNDAQNKESGSIVNDNLGSIDEILVVSDGSQDSVGGHVQGALSIVETTSLKKEPYKDEENKDKFTNKRKSNVILSDDDEFEEQAPIKTVVEKNPVPLSPRAESVRDPASDKSKRRKVDESWVVSGRKKTNKGKEHKITLKRTVRPKKYSGDSSDSENFSGDDSYDESDDEFETVHRTKKTEVVKKPPLKKTPVKKTLKSVSPSASKQSPKKPLGTHNPSPSYSLPASNIKNLFQNKSPIKIVTNPKSPAPTHQSSKPAPSMKSLTPGPNHTVSSLLKQFQSQTKSTPAMGHKSKSITAASPAPSTPLQKKLPCWTPPARIGTPGAKSLAPGQSPKIGLRVGLSRNFKSKPLHSGVKYP